MSSTCTSIPVRWTSGWTQLCRRRQPIVDDLIGKLLAAQTRDEQVAAARAIDRVLLWNHYTIPNWFISNHRLAYRNRFAHVTTPPYTLGLRAVAEEPGEEQMNNRVRHSLFRAGLLSLLCMATLAEPPRHALTLYDEAQVPGQFPALRYVNPEAPKGGTLREAGFGSFDSLNPSSTRASPPMTSA